MPEEIVTGCVLRPTPNDRLNIAAVLAAEGEMPEQYIVPAFRHLFDAEFRPIPEKMRTFIRHQGSIPSCVGHATSRQKEAQEGVPMSPRDIYRLAKRADGSGDPLSWGTTLAAAQDVMVWTGVASEAVVPDQPNASTQAYVALDDVTPATEADRSKHKAKSHFFIYRNDFKRTLFQREIPIVTSCGWHSSDAGIGPDGMMKMASGTYYGGHAFACIGWVRRAGKEVKVMVNSHGVSFGDNGLFYVDDDAMNRLSAGEVSLDIEPSLAELLAKWNEMNVKVKDDPRVYRIQYGVKRRFENEVVFFAFGYLFTTDVMEIPKAELDAIPEGIPVDIKDAPFRTRELVREIRQFYGK